MIDASESDPLGTKMFFRIMAWSIALSFGALSSSLISLQHDSAGFHFVFNVWTVISFVVAAAAAWSYWSLLVKFKPKAGRSTATRRGNVARLIIYVAPLLVVGCFGFLYPLKFVASPEKKIEIAQGLGLAIFVLSGVGFLLWRVAQIIDPQQPDDTQE